MMAKSKSANGAAHEVANEVASEVADGLSELGRQVRKQADEAREEAVKGLNSIAETIRQQAREAGAHDDILRNADDVAAGLERAAQYLKANTVDDIREDAETRVRENPWMAIGLALIIGLALGLILRGGRR